MNLSAGHSRGLSMQFQLDLLRESLDDKIITKYHCQELAQKIQGSADLPFECRQHSKSAMKLPTPPTSGNLQKKIAAGSGPNSKPVVVSPFEGLRGGPGRVYHAQVQRRLTSTRRFSKS